MYEIIWSGSLFLRRQLQRVDPALLRDEGIELCIKLELVLNLGIQLLYGMGLLHVKPVPDLIPCVRHKACGLDDARI